MLQVGFAPQAVLQATLPGQMIGLHSSGQPDPHGPGLQPMLHELPPQVGLQRTLPGLQIGLQNVAEHPGSHTQKPPQQSPPKLQPQPPRAPESELSKYPTLSKYSVHSSKVGSLASIASDSSLPSLASERLSVRVSPVMTAWGGSSSADAPGASGAPSAAPSALSD